ncbi:glycosyltransferase, partial [Fulvivirga kasyanovii]
LKGALIQYVRDNKLEEWVEFKGFVKTDELFQFYQEADAFILPSLFEGWGAVLNEAMGFGLPIITSEGVMANEELVRDGINGYIFKDSDHLLSILNKMISMSGEKRAEMGESSMKIITLWHPEKLSSCLYQFLVDLKKQRLIKSGSYAPMEVFSL